MEHMDAGSLTTLIQARFSMGLKFTEAEMATLLGQVYLKYQIVPLVIRFSRECQRQKERTEEGRQADRRQPDRTKRQTDRQKDR